MMRTASQFWRAEQGMQVDRRHHASPPPPPPPPPQQLMILVLALLLATTTSVTQALPTSHIFSSNHKGIGSAPVGAAVATPPNMNLHLAHQPNIPEEELELENLKDSANGAGAERNAPFSGAGAVSKKSGDKIKEIASPTTNRPAAYVKKPENEETPALSDNANSLKYGGAAADLEEALANLAHIPPSKAPSLSVTSGKSMDGQNSKRTRPGTGFSSGGGVSTGMGLLSRAGVNLEVDYTPQDIAEYIFWMGDERGVELAINDFVQEGLITPQDAVKFLEEVKVELSLLRNRYASTISGSPGRIDNNDNSVRGFWEVPARGLSKKQSAANTFVGNGYPLASSSLSSMEQLNAYPSNGNSWTQSRPSSSSTRGVGGYEKDSGNSIEDMLDYEEIVEKLRQADSKVRELALEGIIYELAHELFSTGLEQSPGTSVPTFTTFIENLAANGNISRDLERSVLETLVQALVDAANERGLLIAKEGHSTRVLNSSGKLGTGLSGAQAANGAQAKPILIKKKSIT